VILKGWRVERNCLISPKGLVVSRADLRGIRAQQIDVLAGERLFEMVGSG
jgi:hypothetical protein